MKMADVNRSVRVCNLAEEFGVESAAVLEKCQALGKELFELRNHMSVLSRDAVRLIKGLFRERERTGINKIPDSICRIQFAFRINKSFLSASSHPITILKKYNKQLAKHVCCNRTPITFYAGNRKKLEAYIYHGTAGWGPYYQIKVPRGDYWKMAGHYCLGQEIAVELKISHQGNVSVFLID